MRIIVLGTGPFAVPSAQMILDQGHVVPLVVTRPLVDPTAKKLPVRPVAQWATSHSLPLYEPASINSPEAMERIRELQPDLLFVCDYGQILSRECLAVARLGGINLHGSLLPRHRGAAPVQWTILSGDEQAGVTVIHMTAKLDAGPALAIRSTAILPDETAQDLEPRLSELGVSATAEAVQLLFDWDGESPLGRLQQAGLVTKAPRFHKQQGQLDFRLPSDYLVRLIRACQPWPSTFAELVDGNGKKVRLLIRCARSLDRSLNSDGPEGQVAIVDPGLQGIDWPQVGKQAFLVKCGRGSMLIGRVRPSGKRDMEVAEFLRGHPIDAGAYFALPDPPSVRLA